MKKIFAVCAVSAALAFGGCAQFDSVVQSLSSPAATQAAQNVKTIVQAVACGLSSAASAAQGVEGMSYNGTPIVDAKGQMITNVVYASSTAACQLLGGVPTGTVSVPAAVVVK